MTIGIDFLGYRYLGHHFPSEISLSITDRHPNCQSILHDEAGSKANVDFK